MYNIQNIKDIETNINQDCEKGKTFYECVICFNKVEKKQIFSNLIVIIKNSINLLIHFIHWYNK